MRSWDAYVLIQVKSIDSSPVDAVFLHEGVENFELTRSGGNYDACRAMLG
jgi:hypothetical protein